MRSFLRRKRARIRWVVRVKGILDLWFAPDDRARMLRLRLRSLVVVMLAWTGPLVAHEPVRSAHGMVVTVESHATEIGASVLRQGGNAVDAAVAVGFALAVTHPSAGNLGGGGFMLIRLADGRTTFVDFRERAPLGAQSGMYVDGSGKVTRDSDIGYRASGVPGTPRGFELAHRRYGSMAWPQLLQPAVDLAAKGFPVSYGLARSLKTNEKRLSRFDDSRRIFLREGRFYRPGEILKQPELARTLKGLVKSGARDFYEGQTARLIARDMQAHGGLITLEDLRRYQVIERAPLTGNYRGYSILTAPPPSSGGLGLLQMLGMLESTGFEKAGAGSAVATHYMAEAMRRYFADRSQYLGDPDFQPVPVLGLLDPRYISARRESILPDHATPSSALGPGLPAGRESEETTHYSIVDAAGNAVAVTYTLNGAYGSGVTAAGTGVLLNNEMDDFSLKPGSTNSASLAYGGAANSIQPRKTPLSSMTPTIVLRQGKLYAVVGSPGGPTIISTVLEVLVNLIDFKMNVADAVNAPRFHHQWQPDELNVEPGFSPDTIDRLKARGHAVKVVSAQGEVASIVVSGSGFEGAADPRTKGNAKGY